MAPSRRQYVRSLGRVGGLVGIGALSGCGGSPLGTPAPSTVRVGSKPFAEQEILGYLAFERLKSTPGVRAVDAVGYGDSAANWAATKAGEKHLYWEYTGTAWTELPPRRETRITDPERLFERVRADAREQGLALAGPASYSNEYVLVADREWATAAGVGSISELAAHLADASEPVGVAVNEEFFSREDGWAGVLAHYGVGEHGRELLTDGTFVVTSTGLTDDLLERESVQLASGFATDPYLDRPEFVVLEDDRDHFVPYQPAVAAYAPLVDSTPIVLEALAPVVESLDESTMRRLNRRAIVDGHSPHSVAQEHLEGVVDPDGE